MLYIQEVSVNVHMLPKPIYSYAILRGIFFLHNFLRGRYVMNYSFFYFISFAKTPNVIKRNKQVNHILLTLMRSQLD